MSANLCIAAESRSPSLAVRRMVSARYCTGTELTGSGRDATAASSACFMMLRVSGAKDLKILYGASGHLWHSTNCEAERRGSSVERSDMARSSLFVPLDKSGFDDVISGELAQFPYRFAAGHLAGVALMGLISQRD